MAKSHKWAVGLALTLGIIALVGIFTSPVLGAVYAAGFFAVAGGMWRGRPWAAIFGIYFTLAPLIRAVLEIGNAGQKALAPFAVSAVMLLAMASVLAIAAASLWKRTARPWRSPVWQGALALTILSGVWFRPYTMPTTSMKNTFVPGDSIVADVASVHLGREPRRDELLVFRYPIDRREIYVKRVAGVPGDRLRMEDKQLYRNGTALAEPYAIHTMAYVDLYRDDFPSVPSATLPAAGLKMLRNDVRNGEVLVPPGKYFVLGDNRDDSLDSRYWGFVSKEDIIGKPVMIYQSVDLHASRRTIRWDRFFKLL